MTVAAYAKLLQTSCTLLARSPSLDEDGKPEIDENGEAVIDVEETDTVCLLQQEGSSDAGPDGAVSSSFWRVFLPSSATVRGWDAISVDGHVYELQGDPWEVPCPRTGAVHHVEARVRRTE